MENKNNYKLSFILQKLKTNSKSQTLLIKIYQKFNNHGS